MTLIKSISGIRGTIGGKKGDNLSPEDTVLFTAAYGNWLKEQYPGQKCKVVIGRDARVSGEMMARLVSGTFIGLGIDVVDLGLSTTPTVEMAVPGENAQGGIILTASHNPFQWNALKLLNAKGEFISGEEGARIIELAERGEVEYADAKDLGRILSTDDWREKHTKAILELDMVDVEAIEKRRFKVVVDAVNSTGGMFVPHILRALGVNDIIEIHCEPNGHFPHNPEPLKENLVDLSKAVVENKADLGIAVDPDVDRLVFVSEDGELFGEEYTLVAVSDYVLSKKKGNTVSNLSSTRALRDVTVKHGGEYYASAVGEVNVVDMMKKVSAVIGGEGNGGIILPELHYGRDALVGIALFLSHLSTWNGGDSSMTELKKSYPEYFMSKNKMSLEQGMNVTAVLNKVADLFSGEDMNDIDGLKIDFSDEWVHLRKSNTEPIIRIYTESGSQESAKKLAENVIKKIESVL
jgi:phosphomannomutase